MPVILTPVTTETSDSTTPVSAGGALTPEVSAAFDTDLLGKKRAFTLRQKFKTPLQFQLLSDCDAVTLTTAPTVIYSEASLAIDKRVTGTSTIVNTSTGIIQVAPPASIRNTAGIYLLEAAILDDDGDPIFSNELYLYIERSAFGNRPIGPPTVSDIRLGLRDSDAGENELLTTYQFGTVEIAHAATQAVQIWNTASPAMAALRFSTLSFPYRDVWTQGINAILFDMATEHYRKNMLPYSAGGVNIEDYQGKMKLYEAAAARRMQDYRERVTLLKAQANATRGFGYL